MSAMGRLATELHLIDAGEIDLSAQTLAALVRLGYEPADDRHEAFGRYAGELDVLDPEKTAALAWVGCDVCDYSDVAIDMILQFDGEYLCPDCDYIEYRQHMLAGVGR